MARSLPLRIEQLEDRVTPSQFGVAWPDPQHLTLSFVPDGTATAGQSKASALFRTLDDQMPTPVWQSAVLKAFQTWAVNANINIGIVKDDGSVLGGSGAPQGDNRYGDIRIGTFPFSGEALAVASPFDVLAGTWSGDVRLNPSYDFSSGAKYDLFSVLLHEAGHVFGLGESDSPSSAMYPRLVGARAGISSSDVAALQALYGARAPDKYDAARTNDSIFAPTRLTHATANIDADLTTPNDVDYYQFQAEGNADTLTFRLRTNGLSLLTPRLSVYDASGALVQSAASAGPLTGDLAIVIRNTRACANYYVKVEKAVSSVFGVGAYRLEVQPAGAAAPFVAFNDDARQPIGSIGSALNLQPKFYRADARFDYVVRASISEPANVDYFRFKTPKLDDDEKSVMAVMVWSAQPNELRPKIDVFDSEGRSVAADIHVNENGTYVVQIARPLPNAQYSVAVRAANPADPAHNHGNYFLAIDFRSRAVQLRTVVDDRPLTAAQPQQYAVLHAPQNQLFHFVLTVGDSASAAGVRMTLFDKSGAILTQLLVTPNEAGSVTLYLPKGDYLFRFDAVTPSGGAVAAPVPYKFRSIGLSDPVGPYADDTTLSSGGGSLDYWWDVGFYLFLSYWGPGGTSG